MSTEAKTGIQTSIAKLLRCKLIEKVHTGCTLAEAAKSVGVEPRIARRWWRSSKWFRKKLRQGGAE